MRMVETLALLVLLQGGRCCWLAPQTLDALLQGALPRLSVGSFMHSLCVLYRARQYCGTTMALCHSCSMLALGMSRRLCHLLASVLTTLTALAMPLLPATVSLEQSFSPGVLAMVSVA